MSENFYPQPPTLKPKHYIAIAVLAAVTLAGGIAAGYWLAQPHGEEIPPKQSLSSAPVASVPSEQEQPAQIPAGPFTESFTEGQLLAYRLDAEIAGGGAELGEFSDVYMNFGTDVTLYTQKVTKNGSADLTFSFENTSLAGTLFDNPFEMTFEPPAADGKAQPDQTVASASPQTTFLTTPIEMRVAPDGTVLDISGPGSLKEMLGSIATVPRLAFPDTELSEGLEWESRLRVPVPGIADAINTTVLNKFVGRQRMSNYDCGVVLQEIGAKRTNTQGSAPAVQNEKPMVFNVPLFDLEGENTIYFDLKTGRLVHAVLNLDFALRIKEQLGDAGKFLQQLVPGMAGEKSVPGLDKLLNPEGKPDLVDLSLKINGAMSLLNEGTPTPLPN